MSCLALTAITASGQNGPSIAEQEQARIAKNLRARDLVETEKNRVAEVARANGLHPAVFEVMAQKQPHLWVDRSLRLFYVCEGLVVSDAEAADAPTALVAQGAATAVTNTTNVFQLHSLPGAPRVIYLDFDGHVTTGTSWNSSRTGGAAINSAPFDFDGNPSNWSTAEQDRIRRIWQRVADDFMAFAVNVTTEDPGVEALRRSGSSDNNYGIRVVISPSSSWYGSAGGVAYLGSFQWSSDTPAFVFSDKLGPNNEKYVAEAITHETGHALGLAHDGRTDGTAYYGGHGDWAPIMGVGYNKGVTHWSKGEYANANNLEDDLAKMQTYGAPLMADDVGDDLASAAPLSGSPVAAVAVIGWRTDVDVFRINSGAGTISLNVAGTGPEMNVDIKADLLNSAGGVIASSNPAGLAASISAAVAPGTYYLRIEGVGTGDPATNGYSDYGSIGEYAITGSIPAANTQVAPIAVVAATPTSGTAPLNVSLSAAGSSDSDGTIVGYSWNFGDGSTASASTANKVYSTPGTYTVTLTVTDNHGLTATSSTTITVTPAATVPAWNTLDGSFENPSAGSGGWGAFLYNPTVPNYTFSTESGITRNGSGFTSGNPNTPDGSQVAFVQMRGTITTTVSFPAGNYRIRALVANRANYGGAQSVIVTVNNQQVGTFTGSSNYVSAATNAFSVAAGNHTIRFAGQTTADATLFIDQLVIESVSAVPSPVGVASSGFEAPSVGANAFGAFVYRPATVPGSQDWTFTGNAGVTGNNSGFTAQNPSAPEGGQVAFVQTNDGVISQSLSFPQTGSYTLTLMAAQRGNWNQGSQTVQVYLDNVLIGSVAPNGTTYQSFSIPFTATQGAHTLSFRGTTAADSTAFLDKIQISSN
jgi:PKD repeat protein